MNLKTKEGKEIVLKLAKEADVLVENFVPGSMDRLGLGYEALSQLNPRIVYCSISGFGQSGPFRDRPAYEPILQAMSGNHGFHGRTGPPPGQNPPSNDRLLHRRQRGFCHCRRFIRTGEDRPGAKDRCGPAGCGPLCHEPLCNPIYKEGENCPKERVPPNLPGVRSRISRPGTV